MKAATNRHLCFDKDGTLIDVHSYWAHITRLRAERIIEAFKFDESCKSELVAAMGVDPDNGRIRASGPVGRKPRPDVIAGAVGAIANLIDSDPRELAGKAAEHTSLLTELFLDVDRYQQQSNDYSIILLPGVAEFVRQASAAGFSLSIFSSDRRANIQKSLERVGLADFFPVLVGGDDVSRGKPDPEGFLKACQEVGIAPQNSVYIGDTTEDLVMARSASSSKLIGVTTGLASHAELTEITEHVYSSLQTIDLERLAEEST